jgi:hypothetical protein
VEPKKKMMRKSSEKNWCQINSQNSMELVGTENAAKLFCHWINTALATLFQMYGNTEIIIGFMKTKLWNLYYKFEMEKKIRSTLKIKGLCLTNWKTSQRKLKTSVIIVVWKKILNRMDRKEGYQWQKTNGIMKLKD